LPGNYSLRQPKIYNAKEEKAKINWRVILLSILIFILLCGLIYLIYFSPFFKIKSIEILGTAPAQVEEKLSSFKNKNIFLVETKSAEDMLIKDHSEYLSVQIYKGIPDALRVKFKEREPQIIWSNENKMYYLDQDGVAFEEAKNLDFYPVIKDNQNLEVTIPSKIATNKFIGFVKQVDDKFKEGKFENVTFEINDTIFQITATVDKIKVIFDTLRPLSDQYDAFRTVYDKHKSEISEYVDVRVEGWVYYK